LTCLIMLHAITKDGPLKMIPDADEIRSGYVRAVKDMGSDKVNCQVEGLLKAKGHSWIWTPAYCPWLQPVRAQRQPAEP
jgi:hypothetical protein